MTQDPELNAMSHMFEIIKNLDKNQIMRIVRWAGDRFVAAAAEKQQQVQEKTTGEETETRVEPVIEKAMETAAKPPGKKDIKDYDTVLDLFSESNVKKVTARILLMAAYLQERHNYKEISSYDINFRLKRINHGVPNISSLINGILKKKPPLMVQLDEEVRRKQSRRKFKVTEAGVNAARRYLKNH